MQSLTNALNAYKKARNLRLHGMIARELGIAILSGQYQPGEVLLGEVAACEQLSVSRSSYREAIRILAAKGLVKPKTRVGTRVCPMSNWSMLDPEILAWTFDGHPDRHLLRSLFELRGIVEPSAARLAATRCSAKDLEAMQAALERMERLTLQTVEGRSADQDFHAILLRASRNPYIVCLERNVRAAVEVVASSLRRTRAVSRDPLPDHRRVFEAIAKGDAAQAEAAMRALIQLAQADFRLADTHSTVAENAAG